MKVPFVTGTADKRKIMHNKFVAIDDEWVQSGSWNYTAAASPVFFATMEVMLALEFFSWWYGQGWRLQFQNLERRLTRTSHVFSVPILLRTLFSPWRRIISYPGAGLEAHARAIADNFVSRMVGFIVRIMVLFSAGVILAIVFLVSTLELIAWPLLPLAVPATLIRGIIG